MRIERCKEYCYDICIIRAAGEQLSPKSSG